MTTTATPSPTQKPALSTLMIGAVGVVYGDIGTSPLYAFKETFSGPHPLALDRPHVLGVLSLVFWAITLIVSVKYVTFMMRADNRGEGGSLALLALLGRKVRNSNLSFLVVVLGIFAAALFYGDSIITPAISVLSAVEGLEVATPAFRDLVIPLTLGVLTGLFLMQRSGTSRVGRLFGPVMLLWFGTLAVLGVINIIKDPEVLMALNPMYAIEFFALDQWKAFLALGSVVLAVTGAEAVYADMGHFGRLPIRYAWFGFVLPALLLNYFGQGALVLREPDAIANPFFHLVPEWALIPLVILATAATVIASQAVISGTFSVTRQAIQLGFLPRMIVTHTSAREIGQVYLPFINWLLFVLVVALVLGFGSSSNLASAYGIAVTGTMIIDSILIALAMLFIWRWNRMTALALATVFLITDLAFFSANITKILHGGWFPLVVALVIFVLLTTWKRGRMLLLARVDDYGMSLEQFIASLDAEIPRVAGTAVFMTASSHGIPAALLHNLKHNKVLHEHVVSLTVKVEDVPYVPVEDRIEVTPLSKNFYRATIRFGFMDEPDIPRALAQAHEPGLKFDMMEVSIFLSRENLVPSRIPGMALWREQLFAWMSRSAATPMEFFKLPVNRVVELGAQVEI